MIQITLASDDPISFLIAARADLTGQSHLEVAENLVRESFKALVLNLHDQFMRGEISQGYMADQLGIRRVDLVHLLDAMGLAVTNL